MKENHLVLVACGMLQYEAEGSLGRKAERDRAPYGMDGHGRKRWCPLPVMEPLLCLKQEELSAVPHAGGPGQDTQGVYACP